ncbi:MAG: ABC transporter ATP-binding protein [Alteromonadaceae bacterium]|nr:ABC transporter ATP-binding protein [Alteromonadaceae bacterium]
MIVDLVIKNLVIKSESQILVDHLSLTLRGGETLTILGETGAGKSLLAHAILGDLPDGLSVSGAVYVGGVNMLSAGTVQRESIWGKTLGMLPQEPRRALSPLMKISRQIAEVGRYVRAKPKTDAEQSASQILASMGLAQDKDKVPSQLSGGMAQRAAFACVWETGCQVLLADEPTKGLDSMLRDEVISQLQSFAKQGSLLTITHNIDVARQLGGTVIVMQQGRVVETAKAEDLLSSPKSTYARALINADAHNWTKLPTSTTAQSPLVTATNVAVKRGNNILFSNFNLTLAKGEIVGLCGPSGCGKTSLADALLGVLSYQGNIDFHHSLKRHQKLKLYQEPPNAFAADVPLKRLLADVVKQHKIAGAPLASLCDTLGLDASLLERTATEVSGGELQRVALLRALLLKPSFLVADEPTSRLDLITSEKITRLLVDQCRAMQCTLLFISHDHIQLSKVCDRVITLEQCAKR